MTRLGRGEDVQYARAVATCPGLDRAPYVEVYAIREGGAGSRLISACRLQGGPFGSILVDRGFVADIISARPPEDAAATDPVTVTGVLRRPDPPGAFTPRRPPTGRLWYGRDTAAMARALNAERPAPLFLAAETSTNPDWRALVPAPLPEAISNNHLAYALTWFGLAAALAGVYLAMLFRRARGA
jgi:surfeit locus 1 family protein